MKGTLFVTAGRPLLAAFAVSLGFVGMALPAVAADQSAASQLVPAAQPPWARLPTTAAPAPAQAAIAAPKPAPPPAPTTPAAAAASAKPEPPGMPPPPTVPTANAKAPAKPPPAVAQTGSTEPPSMTQAGSTALLQSPLAVTRWGFSATAQPDANGGLTIVAKAGRPLQLWLTIEGGQSAVDQLRATGRVAIDVHWERADKSAPGAQDLNTELTIGRPGLAATFAEQVQKQGHFEWHVWSRKDALSPGQWTVSLTYPDGSPVQCGQTRPQPCRLSVTAG